MWLFPCPPSKCRASEVLSPGPRTFCRVGHCTCCHLLLSFSRIQVPTGVERCIAGACHLAHRALDKCLSRKGSLTNYQHISHYNTKMGSDAKNTKISRAGRSKASSWTRVKGDGVCSGHSFQYLRLAFGWEENRATLPLTLHRYLFPLPTPQLILLY